MTKRSAKGRSRGRPSKLTPATQKILLRALEHGNFREVAARQAGIHRDTFYHWFNRGCQEESGCYREFSDAAKKAEAVGENFHVQRIHQAAKTYWQSSAWWLERKYPHRWGRHAPITSEQIKEFLGAIVEVICRHVKEPAILAAIHQDLAKFKEEHERWFE